MFTSGLLKLLFTTETFALGINMPARMRGLLHAAQVRRHQLRLHEHARLHADGRPRRAPGHRRGGPRLSRCSRRATSPKRRSSASSSASPSRSRAASASPSPRSCTSSSASAARACPRPGRSPSTSSSTAAGEQEGADATAASSAASSTRTSPASTSSATSRATSSRRAASSRARSTATSCRSTELVFRGTLENLPLEALGVVFVGLVFEERRKRRDLRLLAPVRQRAHERDARAPRAAPAGRRVRPDGRGQAARLGHDRARRSPGCEGADASRSSRS